MDGTQERHRPGLLKQQNKAHKHGKHRSKGSIDSAAKGKVSVKVVTKKFRHELRKDERRNKAVQLRKKKRDESFSKKRMLGGSDAPPFLVAVVPLCENVDPDKVIELFKQADEAAVITKSLEGNVHISVPRFKQRFCFMLPHRGDLFASLDALKVADTVLFLVAGLGKMGVDGRGVELITGALAQGLPTPVLAITDLDQLPSKVQHKTQTQLQKIIQSWFPEEKLMPLTKSSDALGVLRRIGNQKQRPVAQRDFRPHMVAEVVERTEDGELLVSGYIRGQPLSVNSLVHIPGWGDFQMSRIDAPDDPFPVDKSKLDRKSLAGMDVESEVRVLEIADPTKQESLQSEVPLDPMEGEQTWPTEEELLAAEEERKNLRLVKKIPKGMSEYQAAWIPDCDAEEVVSGSEDEDAMCVEAARSEDSSVEDEEAAEECESVTVTEGVPDAERYDEKMDLTEEEETLKKIKEAREDSMFPDEVDTPQDTPARIRFQKYRGLQSFRTSPWDPKENLPRDYARIFQFQNFAGTRKKVLKSEEKEGVLPGWYVTLHITNVPDHLINSRRPNHPMVVFGMLPHEQKMSVMNVVIRRPPLSVRTPVKSKEQLIFHIGYRRFKACPIFSQHTNGNKHKYERYYQPDETVVATMFAPIVYPPCTVLVYKEMMGDVQGIVGVGSVLSINPDRIISKRAVLSGHPLKVHKRSAVVRFMFFNREDIAWFKPVELRTKHGRRGHIKEPLGTHGHMKCVFDGQLKSQDTVLMNLYKRVFPSWSYEPYVEAPPNPYTTGRGVAIQYTPPVML